MHYIPFWTSSLEMKGVNTYFSEKAILQDLCAKSCYRAGDNCFLTIIRGFVFCIHSYLSLHTFLTQTIFKASLPETSGFSLFKKGENFFLNYFNWSCSVLHGIKRGLLLHWRESLGHKYRSVDLLYCNHSHLTISPKVV